MSNLNPGGLAWLGLAALAAAPVQIVVAADYLSVEQAQKALFPQADRFTEVVLGLSPAQRDQVMTLAGPQPPHRSLRAFKGFAGDALLGYVFIDEVIGKEDFITYAVSIDAAGKLGPIEILSYRESHGGEIRAPAWRHQFVGRRDLNELRAPDGSPLEQGQVCPLHPQMLEVADTLIRDIAPFCTAGKVHVGLDESFSLGRHPLSIAEIREVGLGTARSGKVNAENNLVRFDVRDHVPRVCIRHLLSQHVFLALRFQLAQHKF